MPDNYDDWDDDWDDDFVDWDGDDDDDYYEDDSMTEEQIRLKKSYALNDPDTETIWNYKKSRCDGGEVVASYEEGLEKLRVFADGISYTPAFALLMEHNGELRVFRRPDQPCAGGELRKYHDSHGDMYTNPQPCNGGIPMDKYRPGDLYYPFPLGTPRALMYCMGKGHSVSKELEELVFDEGNPYRDAVRGLTFIAPEGRVGAAQYGPWGEPTQTVPVYSGMLFEDLDVDSTVLVNFIQTILYYSWGVVRFRQMGLSPMRAWAASMMYSADKTAVHIVYPAGANHHRSATLDPKTLLEKPHDLTGGTFVNRYDYNRNRVAFLFHGKWRPVPENLTPGMPMKSEDFVAWFNEECDKVGLK